MTYSTAKELGQHAIALESPKQGKILKQRKGNRVQQKDSKHKYTTFSKTFRNSAVESLRRDDGTALVPF